MVFSIQVFNFLGHIRNAGLIAIVDVGPLGSSESDSEALYPDPLGLTSSANVATGRKTSCCVEMC